jgi:flagellar motor switch/type III secretory pathway protein FliN
LTLAVAAGGSKQGPCADVTAEIGGLRGVSLGALLGEVPLDLRRSDPILLRVDDVPWAEGELTAIDGALAVRITRMMAD